MRKYVAFVGSALLLSLAGCQAVYSPATGLLYMDVKGPITATDLVGMKSGEACAQTIMALVATGDASIEAAKAAGGIKEVATVDHHSTNILGIFGKFCTVVRGK